MKININNTKFLNKETDIKHKDIVTIASEGAWEVSSIYKKEDGTPSNQFEITIKLENEEVRGTVLSYKNLSTLVSIWGDETSLWVGKKLRAWKTSSDRAKLGYTYFYVPTDWTRDDTGEWIIPETTYPEKFTSEKEQALSEEDRIAKITYDENDNPSDIPF